MNSKKNKNKNKPKVNPNPLQKVDSTSTVEKSEEAVEEKPEITLKSDERVPEIVSEIASTHVATKVLEGDAPKKPKRNRGKKKKCDKENENEDNEEQKPPEPVIEELIVIEQSIVDNPEIETSKDFPNIIPTARKKKNKNKKNIELPIKDQKEAEIEVTSTPVKEDVKTELVPGSCDTIQETSVAETFEPSDQESKSSKKKNKKKKRSDSERSDKADDTVVCTGAFQQLLEPKEDKKDDRTESKAEEKPISLDTIISDFALENVKIKREKIETASQTETKTDEMVKENISKGKKKNKKQIKHLAEGEGREEKVLEIGTFAEPLSLRTDITTEYISQEKGIEEQTESLNFETPSIVKKENSPKPKPKIAKPVEKKHIQKPDIVSYPENIISLKSITAKEKNSDLQINTETSILKDISDKEELKTDITDTTKSDITAENQQKITDTVQTFENIKVPQSGMGKKRKKSPKPPNRTGNAAEVTKSEFEMIEKSDEGTKEKITINMEVVSTPIPLEDIPTKDDNKSIIEIKNESPTNIKCSGTSEETTKLKITEAIQIPTAIEISLQDTIQQVKASESSTTKPKITEVIQIPTVFETSLQDTGEEVKAEEPSDSTQIFETQKPEQMQVPDSGKKKKKSPKLSKKLETTPEIQESTEVKDIDSNVTKSAEHASSDRKEKAESPLDLPPLEDIEIHSVKTDESDELVSDVIPDIHYPRASSQLLDNNNNLMIQEISTEETKLNIPIIVPDTPFIQGSGETPIITPEIISTGIRITEIDTTVTKPNVEKTDLKSKVMEVNKDMEDLRKSIEKSLAELTAMENTEKETEKQFEESQMEIKGTETVILKKDVIDKEEMKDIPSEKHVQTILQTAPLEDKDIAPINILPEPTQTASVHDIPIPPVCPSRKDHKGKNKSKKKGKQEAEQRATSSTTTGSGASVSTITTSIATAGVSNIGSSTVSETKESSQGNKKEEKTEQKSENSQGKGKQQCSSFEESANTELRQQDELSKIDTQTDYNPIENFEDAMTSSADDVNHSFEIIANDANKTFQLSQGGTEEAYQNNPEISITSPTEEDEKGDKEDKINPVSQPKNLIGHPNIPARLYKTDYKKEKNKTQQMAKVKIKDAVPVEVNKQSKDDLNSNKDKILKDQQLINQTLTMTKEKDEYIYKYSFRKVFLPSACHVCKKNLKQSRVPCSYCNLIFYCSKKHKDEDYAQHQAFCFAVSTIVHLKDQKFIYADAKDVVGHNYRLLRMQMIVSCEKVLKRKLAPWEQEALLYPRICADVGCREWRQEKLKDCEGCGQIAYCIDHDDHYPKSHQRWCNSYSLYQKLVSYQQSSGRLVPKLPSRVMMALNQMPEKLNEVLASMYEEKIDINDTQYAALTQIATAPLTAAYSQQLYSNKMNSTYANGFHKNSSFTIHVVGAELQFEADALNKWEMFFLHLRPDIKELRVVLIGTDLNSSNLPLNLLGKVKLCDNCNQNNRRVIFNFQDKKTYQEYWSTDFVTPDLVCAFNPSIHRASTYNGRDMWPATIRCVLKLKIPFVVTSYSMTELIRDLARIKECAEVEFNTISEPKLNAFASVRPDRNFISDDEIPLLFKNYCFAVVCGVF